MVLSFNIIENVEHAFMELIIKFVSHLPLSPFDFSSFLGSINTYLPQINYFIPFYLFKSILIAWVGVIFVSAEIFLLVKWVKAALLSGA